MRRGRSWSLGAGSHVREKLQRALIVSLTLGWSACTPRAPATTSPTSDPLFIPMPQSVASTSAYGLPKPISLAKNTSTKEDMVKIPGGTFQLRELPRKTVTVAPFELDVTEVTLAAYSRCVASGKCTPAGTHQYWMNHQDQGESPACNGNRPDRQNHPVNCVDWSQATAYCQFVGKRLPTRPEWEYAERGGPQDLPYPWGTALPENQLCWSGVTKREGTCPVRSFPAEVFGLYDMAGNVLEWTQSPFDDGKRIYAGDCSWDRNRGYTCTGESWDARHPTHRENSIGFRCAK